MVQFSTFKGGILDKLLAEGKYRMGTDMLSCDYIINEHYQLLNVIWARYLVDNVANPLNHKIYKKSKNFTVKLTDFVLTDEIRELAQKYCNSRVIEVNFDENYFYNEFNINPFDTKTILIYDNQKLIAVGYFDEGLDCIMGLKNLFDPDYHKYSLGKFIMLLKMQYCIEHQIRYYYPGYIACESEVFDYKLFFNAEAIELKINGYWINFAHFESKEHACETQVMKYELRRREDNLDEGEPF